MVWSSPGQTSLTWPLDARSHGITRLLTRFRSRLGLNPRSIAFHALVELGDIWMTRKGSSTLANAWYETAVSTRSRETDDMSPETRRAAQPHAATAVPLASSADRLDSLLSALDKAETDHTGDIAAVDAVHRPGALNLVHFTTMRQLNVRALQSDLMDIGVASLAVTGADVRAKVVAAQSVVAALRGDHDGQDLDALRRALLHGENLLHANSRALFGPMRDGRPTRIMVTLPSEAADQPDLVAAFVEAGMDVARINCAHDTPEAWERMAKNVRTAATSAGRQVLVSMDLPGPKLRTGPVADGPSVGRARVRRDDSGTILAPASLWLTSRESPESSPSPQDPIDRRALRVTVDGAWLAARKIGDRVAVPDVRGRQRTLTVMHAEDGRALAASQRNVYLTNGSSLSCDGSTTTVGGIPPIPRRLSLQAGDRVILTTDLTPAEQPEAGADIRIGCTLPEAVAALQAGDAVLFDDGAILAEVETVADGEAALRVQHTKPGGQRLGSEKGINLPDTDVPLTALTADDEQHLSFIAQHADIVAVSFIRTAADVEHVLGRLTEAGAEHLGLVLKIETRQGFENLPGILLVAMRHSRVGIMIARGDLAVEIGFERMAEVPRQILALCEAAHVPSIWATQVLENLAKTGTPSRAEITDAAASQRADCVMLNKGPYITAAIEVLDDILVRIGEVQHKSRTLIRRIHSWDAQ
jgi:pyruvate kinase